MFCFHLLAGNSRLSSRTYLVSLKNLNDKYYFTKNMMPCLLLNGADTACVSYETEPLYNCTQNVKLSVYHICIALDFLCNYILVYALRFVFFLRNDTGFKTGITISQGADWHTSS